MRFKHTRKRKGDVRGHRDELVVVHCTNNVGNDFFGLVISNPHVSARAGASSVLSTWHLVQHRKQCFSWKMMAGNTLSFGMFWATRRCCRMYIISPPRFMTSMGIASLRAEKIWMEMEGGARPVSLFGEADIPP